MILELRKDGKTVTYMALFSGYSPRFSTELKPYKTVDEFFDNWRSHRNGELPEFDEIKDMPEQMPKNWTDLGCPEFITDGDFLEKQKNEDH